MASKADADAVLKLAIETRALLDEKISELQREIAAKQIPHPPSDRMGDAFDIYVQFQQGGKKYRYLLLRFGKQWFTTGQSKNAYFADWPELIRWLRGPDVHWYSTMTVLRPDTTAGYPLKSSVYDD